MIFRAKSEPLLPYREFHNQIGSDRRINGENCIENTEYATVTVLLRYLCFHIENGRIV